MRQSATNTASFTKEDETILNSVDRYLADGLALKRWWDSAEPQARFDQKFDLTRAFNRPSTSYGFFAKAPVTDGTMSIMGNVQDLLYDHPKVPPVRQQESVEWMRQQLREFALHYFMRVSSFRQPETVVPENHPAPPSFLANLSLCPTPDPLKEGFGFQQLYYKTANGEIGKFTDQSAIVDVREIGDKYEWIVLKVKIFNFAFKVKPLGPGGPEMRFALDESSYLVMTQDFVLDENKPGAGTAGRYGVGYAFIKNTEPNLIAYGPGEFAAAIELIEFRISESGEISTHMVFVVNRPDKIANVPVDPVGWSFEAANLFSLGTASWFMNPVRDALKKLPLRFGTFDPVYTSIDLLNTVTRNLAAERLCISKETLDKSFLVQHFNQHYETIVGSLLTWRQVRDWLDSSSLPNWVVTGRSS